MAIFSVYNYDTRRYDYYESPKTHADLGFVFALFREPRTKSGELGEIPESIASSLPAIGLTRIGSGQSPRGVIATDKSLSSTMASSSFSTGALAGIDLSPRASLITLLLGGGALLYIGYRIKKGK